MTVEPVLDGSTQADSSQVETGTELLQESEQTEAELCAANKAAVLVAKRLRGWMMRQRFKRLVCTFQVSDVARPLRLRSKLVLEVHSTEETYLKGLEQLHNEFEKPLRKLLGLTDICLNLGTLLVVHRAFFRKLAFKVTQLPLPMELGEMFLELADKLQCYKRYTANYCHTVSVLEEIHAAMPDLAKALPGGKGWNTVMGQLLILPIQRIPRYVMLLKDIMKYTVEEHTGKARLCEALIRMQEVASDVNESTRAYEMQERLRKIEAQLPFSESALIPVVKYGSLQAKFTKKKSWRQCFCVVRAHVLYGFAQRLDANQLRQDWARKVLWCLPLHAHSCCASELPGPPHSPAGKLIHIFRGDSTKSALSLLTTSESEQQAWLAALTIPPSREQQLYGRLTADHRVLLKEGPLQLQVVSPTEFMSVAIKYVEEEDPPEPAPQTLTPAEITAQPAAPPPTVQPSTQTNPPTEIQSPQQNETARQQPSPSKRGARRIKSSQLLPDTMEAGLTLLCSDLLLVCAWMKKALVSIEVIPLVEVLSCHDTTAEPGSTEESTCFAIRTSLCTRFCHCASVSEKEAWIEALRAACKKFQWCSPEAEAESDKRLLHRGSVCMGARPRSGWQVSGVHDPYDARQLQARLLGLRARIADRKKSREMLQKHMSQLVDYIYTTNVALCETNHAIKTHRSTLSTATATQPSDDTEQKLLELQQKHTRRLTAAEDAVESSLRQLQLLQKDLSRLCVVRGYCSVRLQLRAADAVASGRASPSSASSGRASTPSAIMV